MRAFAALVACLALAACAAGAPRDRYDRLLTPRADPSAVIAAELAMARTARERGQWTAFRRFAADDALIFGSNGAIEARPWLKAQKDPPQAVAWEPHAVWSSCDGSLAVTRGGFRAPDGTVGAFYTVWRRQRDGEHKWVFDFASPTPSAPAAPERIAAEVSACRAIGAEATAEPALAVRRSRDNSLAWSFLMADGARRFVVWQAGEAGDERVVDVTAPPAEANGSS